MQRSILRGPAVRPFRLAVLASLVPAAPLRLASADTITVLPFDGRQVVSRQAGTRALAAAEMFKPPVVTGRGVPGQAGRRAAILAGLCAASPVAATPVHAPTPGPSAVEVPFCASPGSRACATADGRPVRFW